MLSSLGRRGQGGVGIEGSGIADNYSIELQAGKGDRMSQQKKRLARKKGKKVLLCGGGQGKSLAESYIRRC